MVKDRWVLDTSVWVAFYLRESAALFEKGEPDFPKRLSEQKAQAMRAAIARIEAAQERPELRRLK